MLLRALQDVPDWSVAAARSPLCALSALLPLSALRVRRLRGDQWITVHYFDYFDSPGSTNQESWKQQFGTTVSHEFP